MNQLTTVPGVRVCRYGCDKYGYDGVSVPAAYGCTKPKAQKYVTMAYFVVFTFIGAFVLLTTFVGVITTAMEEASDGLKSEAAILSEATAVATAEEIGAEDFATYFAAFNMIDMDKSRKLEPDEIRLALESVGYRVPATVQSDIARAAIIAVQADGAEMDTSAAMEQGDLTMPEFVSLMNKLKLQHDAVQQKDALKRQGLNVSPKISAVAALDSVVAIPTKTSAVAALDSVVAIPTKTSALAALDSVVAIPTKTSALAALDSVVAITPEFRDNANSGMGSAAAQWKAMQAVTTANTQMLQAIAAAAGPTSSSTKVLLDAQQALAGAMAAMAAAGIGGAPSGPRDLHPGGVKVDGSMEVYEL
jgi:hypothetical protein